MACDHVLTCPQCRPRPHFIPCRALSLPGPVSLLLLLLLLPIPSHFLGLPAPTASFHFSVPRLQPFLPLRADPAPRPLGARPYRPTTRPGTLRGRASPARSSAGRGGGGGGGSEGLRAALGRVSAGAFAASQRRPTAERSAGPQPLRGGPGTGGTPELSGHWSGRRHRSDRGAGAAARLRDIVAGPDPAGCERRRHGTRSVSPSAGDWPQLTPRSCPARWHRRTVGPDRDRDRDQTLCSAFAAETMELGGAKGGTGGRARGGATPRTHGRTGLAGGPGAGSCRTGRHGTGPGAHGAAAGQTRRGGAGRGLRARAERGVGLAERPVRDVRERQVRGQGAAADGGPGGWGAPGARSSVAERAPTAGGSSVQGAGEARSASTMGTMWQGPMQRGDVPRLGLWELGPARKNFIRLFFVGDAF